MKANIFNLIIIMLLFQACIYDFEPESKSYENRLVIYSLVTNESRPLEVFINKTVNINVDTITPETGANVMILDNKNNITEFYETNPGTYRSYTEFTGIIGNEYKIHIELTNGEIYESEFEELPDFQEIKSADYTYIYNLELDRPWWGCQFFVNTEVENTEGYFRYEMDESWKYQTGYPATSYVNSEGIKKDTSFARVCWRFNDLKEFYITSTEEKGSKKIENFPVSFITNKSERMILEYCLNIKQYSMTKRTYNFWKAQIDNIGTNSLYTKPPFQVRSNIKNINNHDEIVLGYFEVSGFNNKRVFVKDKSIGGEPDLDECELRNLSNLTLSEYENGYFLYEEGYMLPTWVVNEYCVNCELSGASPIKPDYWPN